MRMPARDSARPSARKSPSSCRAAGRLRWPYPEGAARMGARAAASPRSRGRRVPRNGLGLPCPREGTCRGIGGTSGFNRALEVSGGQHRPSLPMRWRTRFEPAHACGARKRRARTANDPRSRSCAEWRGWPDEMPGGIPRSVRRRRAASSRPEPGSPARKGKLPRLAGAAAGVRSNRGGVSGSQRPPCRRFGSRSRRCRPREQAPPRSCPRSPEGRQCLGARPKFRRPPSR